QPHAFSGFPASHDPIYAHHSLSSNSLIHSIEPVSRTLCRNIYGRINIKNAFAGLPPPIGA
ncbi:MAG: hypothetical protein ACK5O9_06590, partial [Holosporales bacterium]